MPRVERGIASLERKSHPMQISFMTWVCPDWDLNQILAAAIRYGYDSVEPRSQCDQKHGIELAATKKRRKEIKSQFADCGVGMSCIATSCTYSLANPEERAKSVATTKRFVDLAAEVGCPNIRVFGGPTPEGADFEEVKEYVAEALRECAIHAFGTGVSVCFETHDSYCKSADALQIVTMADAPQAAICWDIMHPFTHGDTIQEAFDNLKDYIRHCHAHDGTPPPEGQGGGWSLALMGEGQIPHDEAMCLLATTGFKGAISGEWIGWLPAEEVLPHDGRVLREYRKAAEGG